MKIIVITGASSGFGALTARALAKAGHTVYASMRDTTGQNARQVEEAANSVWRESCLLLPNCPQSPAISGKLPASMEGVLWILPVREARAGSGRSDNYSLNRTAGVHGANLRSG
jgi:NAD(P)-dependent dehydrogenase (short-subunit alcohol dehydrogenase family)